MQTYDRYVNAVPAYHGFGKNLLKQMVDEVQMAMNHSSKIVLLGFNDYAKHLINLFGESNQILAVVESDHQKHGWTFRSIPVIALDEAMQLQPDIFVCTAIEERHEFLGRVTAHSDYRHQRISYFPRPTTMEESVYQPWSHSSFYRRLRQLKAQAPISMMNEQKILFLLELLEQTLYLSGDVLEVGVWQGGSAWFMAHLLLHEALPKKLVLVDFFETLPRANSESVMCLDEIKSSFAFYPYTLIHQGNVDMHPEFVNMRQYCFIHYDLGFDAARLQLCFDCLQPGGILLLDNYGLITANPCLFEHWFAQRGHRIAAAPHSEQGWVIKHA